MPLSIELPIPCFSDKPAEREAIKQSWHALTIAQEVTACIFAFDDRLDHCCLTYPLSQKDIVDAQAALFGMAGWHAVMQHGDHNCRLIVATKLETLGQYGVDVDARLQAQAGREAAVAAYKEKPARQSQDTAECQDNSCLK